MSQPDGEFDSLCSKNIDGLRVLIEAGRAQVIHVYYIYTIMSRVSCNRLTWVSFARAHRYRLRETLIPFLNDALNGCKKNINNWNSKIEIKLNLKLNVSVVNKHAF